MSIITYPLDGKYYNAQDAETYLCTRTSGVFSEDISFTPNGMNITVSPFLAWIKNDDFSGKSVAVTTDTTLTISPSEPILSRIDRIVLRFDARKNESELIVLKGTPSSSPAAPSIERTPVIYDLCLCQINVKPSATSISAGNITSTLLDESLCGIMRDGVTGIPTLQLQSQAQALLRELEAAISMAENGSPVLQSLGIKRGVVYVTIGKKGQKIYSSDDVELDTMFYDEPKVIVTRKSHYLNETVFKYIKPQESLRVSGNKFNLDVFSEKDIPTTYTLKYNWIAIGKVKWENGDTGGGEEEPEIEYFNIRTTVSPEGTGTTTGAGNYAKGSTVTLNATPASGYAFEGWYIGSSKITSNASYNITVTSDTIYTAKFVEEVPMITVTVTADPVGAGSVSGAGTYPKGSTVRLTASPGERYRFIGWYSGDSKVSPNTEYSVTLNASMAYVAKFEEEVVTPDYYTIITKVSPTGAGSTTGGGQYAAGTSVKLTATANEGYLFSHWSKGTETRATAEITVAATADQTWTANFIEGEEDTEEKVTITINVEPENAGTVAGNGKVNSGAMSAIQATANSGYKFKHWRFEDGTTNEANPYLFRASADRTFVAVFEEEEIIETTDFQYSVSNNQATITGYTGTGGNVAIPSTLGGYSVTSIGENAFAGNNNITSVTIPNSVTRIDMSAFYNCSNLASIEIPDSVTKIDKGAFYYCTSLEGITIPNSITTIDENTFDKCTNLKNITIPNSVTKIDYEAFLNCTNLKDIYYNGTKSQWNNISKNSAFDGDLNDITVHCTDGDINYVKMTISVSPEGSGSVTTPPTAVIATTGDTFYVKGSGVTFTASHNSGYRFKEWIYLGDDGYTDNPLTIYPPISGSLIAVFEEEATTTETAKLYIYSSNAGTGDVVKLTKDEAGTQPWNKNEFSEGETAYFFAQAGTGRIIERLVCKIDNATVTDMTADQMVERGILNSDKNKLSQQYYVSEGQTSEFVATVYFGAKPSSTYTVTTEVTPEGAGTVTGDGSYTSGSSVTLAATANEGYIFSHWEYDVGGTSKLNPVTFPVEQNVVATAVFLDITNGVTYKISSSNAGSGDTINLYPYDVSSNTLDYSNPLGTTKVLYAGDDTYVYYYAKAGQNRTISSVKLSVGASSETISGEDLNDYFVDGALNIPGGFYDSSEEGTIKELIVYFAET